MNDVQHGKKAYSRRFCLCVLCVLLLPVGCDSDEDTYQLFVVIKNRSAVPITIEYETGCTLGFDCSDTITIAAGDRASISVRSDKEYIGYFTVVEPAEREYSFVTGDDVTIDDGALGLKQLVFDG